MRTIGLTETLNFDKTIHRSLTARPAIERQPLSIFITKIKRNIHTPSTAKILITPIDKSRTNQLHHSFSIIITTNKKKQIFKPVNHDITHEINHITPTDNPSTNVHGDQQSISEINNQRKELDNGMLIANTLKGKLNSQ